MTNKRYAPSDRTVFLIVVLNLIVVALSILAIILTLGAP